MKPKPVIPRTRALQDIEEALDHYLAEGGQDVALGFIDALEQVYGLIALHPEGGSPRFAHELNLPGLRCWPLKRFPQVVFYMAHENRIDVWRVLHGQRDLPAWLVEP
ncbi:MAG: type II toxin-antitoxin system RelE/ParE family toxin [Holophagaceae bacterium]|nr:type II toxin-antitoxin system RelE/ParE family toxin [Holophagaceae bacterium]